MDDCQSCPFLDPFTIDAPYSYLYNCDHLYPNPRDLFYTVARQESANTAQPTRSQGSDLPPKLASPAQRALANAEITSLEQLAT
jgi:hypothetical protein